MQANRNWSGGRAFGKDADDLVNVSYQSHKDALKSLKSALEVRGALGILQGPGGSGKTAIVRRLAQQLRGGYAVAVVDGNRANPAALLKDILAQFGYDTGLESAAELEKMVKVFAAQQARSFAAPTLIVDNVDRMYPGALRTLNTLAELEIGDRYAMRLILTGQEGLESLLASEGMTGIRKRKSASHLLRPMTMKEALIYLNARLGASGVNNAETVFTVDVSDRIYQQAGGWPGAMNEYAMQAIDRADRLPVRVGDTIAVNDVAPGVVPKSPVPDKNEPTQTLPSMTVARHGEVVGEYTLKQNKILIGRSDFADIVIDDQFVSKMHALILIYADALVLLDLNSSNRTLVNSVRITNTILRSNDVISLGDHRLKVRNTPALTDEIAKLLENPDTIKMKNLLDIRRKRAQRLALVSNAPGRKV